MSALQRVTFLVSVSTSIIDIDCIIFIVTPNNSSIYVLQFPYVFQACQFYVSSFGFWILIYQPAGFLLRSPVCVSGENRLEHRMVQNRKAPSLVDLCVRVAIHNLRYIGDVGATDFHLLERFLSHCTVDELAFIEKSTQERDLSPVTDKLWKKFYERQFGEKSTNLVIERMKQKKVTFKWNQLYEAKLKEVEETQQKSFQRIRDLYKEEDAKKQSRQIKLCTKVPPSSSKRSFYGGGSSIYNTKSTVMKKAKMDFLRSPEVKNLAAIRNKAVQRTNSVSVSSTKKPGGPSAVAASSRSKPMNPTMKRF